MADVTFYTFSSNETMADSFVHQGRFSQLILGKEGAENMGGGSIHIQKPTLDGGIHTVRIISEAEFNALQDRSIRLELPDEARIKIKMVGATSPNFYVEHSNQRDNAA